MGHSVYGNIIINLCCSGECRRVYLLMGMDEWLIYPNSDAMKSLRFGLMEGMMFTRGGEIKMCSDVALVRSM